MGVRKGINRPRKIRMGKSAGEGVSPENVRLQQPDPARFEATWERSRASIQQRRGFRESGRV